MTARMMKGPNGYWEGGLHHGEHDENLACACDPKCQPVEPVATKADIEPNLEAVEVQHGSREAYNTGCDKVDAPSTLSASPSTPSKPWLKWNMATLRKRYGECDAAFRHMEIQWKFAQDVGLDRGAEIDRLTAELETAKAEVRLLDDKLEKSNGQLLEIGLQRDQYKLEFQDMRRMRDNETNFRSNFAYTLQTLTKERDALRVELAEVKAERDKLDEWFEKLQRIKKRSFWTPWRVFWAVSIPVTVVVCVGLWAGWWR